MVGHVRPTVRTEKLYFHIILLAKENHLDDPSVKDGKICSNNLVGRTAKSHAKGMETDRGKELGHLMQKMGHERNRSRMLFAKAFNFRKHLGNTHREVGGKGLYCGIRDLHCGIAAVALSKKKI